MSSAAQESQGGMAMSWGRIWWMVVAPSRSAIKKMKFDVSFFIFLRGTFGMVCDSFVYVRDFFN